MTFKASCLPAAGCTGGSGKSPGWRAIRLEINSWKGEGKSGECCVIGTKEGVEGCSDIGLLVSNAAKKDQVRPGQKCEC